MQAHKTRSVSSLHCVLLDSYVRGNRSMSSIHRTCLLSLHVQPRNVGKLRPIIQGQEYKGMCPSVYLNTLSMKNWKLT